MSFSQIVVEGTVKDAEEGGVMFNVLVKIIVPESNPQRIIRYTMTDVDGKYKLSFNSEYREVDIEFSHLGYKQETHRIKAESQIYNISIMPKAFELKEVSVKAPPISSHGDTVNYNVGSFITQFDNKIEDVLKKLPGITIKDNGRIEYQGKAINKFYIEGLDMLEGKYNLATQNIPADKVATVQIFENHQPVRMLKDIRFSDRAALNIKLKEKRMSRPIGNFLLGGGYSDEILYRCELFGFTVNQKQQILFTLKGDNSGYHTFENETVEHYGTNNKDVKVGSLIAELPFSVPSQIKNRSGDISAATASVNTIKKTDDFSTIRLNVAYRRDKKEYERATGYKYYFSDSELIIGEHGDAGITKNEISGSLAYQKNADKLYINDQLDGLFDFGDNFLNMYSGTNYFQGYDMKQMKFRNKLDVYWRKEDKSYGVKSLISGGNIPNNILTINTTASDFPTVQRLSGYSLYTEHSTMFYKTFGVKSSLNLNLNIETEYDKINTNLNKYDSIFVDNDNHGSKIISTAMLEYKLKISRLQTLFQLPFKLYNLSYKDDVLGNNYRKDIPILDANVQFQYSLFSGFSLVGGAGITNSVGDITDIVQGEIQKSYNSSTSNKTGVVGRAKSLGINAGYNYKHMLNGIFSSLMIQCSEDENNVLVGSNVSDKGVISLFSRDTKNYSHRTIGQFYLAKNFHKAQTVLSYRTNIYYSEGKQMRFEQVIPYSNLLISFVPSVDFSYFNNFTLRLSGELNNAAKYVGKGESETKTSNNTYHVNAEFAYLIMKNLELYYELFYANNSLQNSQRENLYFMDCGARYRLNKNIDLELNLYNLTSIDLYTRRQYFNTDEIETSYKIRPFTVLFCLKVNY